jgi:hypothetical protein
MGMNASPAISEILEKLIARLSLDAVKSSSTISSASFSLKILTVLIGSPT